MLRLRQMLVMLGIVASCAARGETRVELPAWPAPEPPPPAPVSLAEIEVESPSEFEQAMPDAREELLARYETARAWMREGRVMQAESLLAAGRPDDRAPALSLLWAYALAYARYALERYPEGIATLAAFGEFTSADRLTRAACALLGDCLYQLDRVGEAEEAYRRAAELLPDPPEGLLRRRALAALAADAWQTAAGFLGDLLLRFPDTAHAAEYNFLRAEAFRWLGRLTEARRHYQRAYALGSDPAACSAALGACDYEEQRWADALARYEFALTGCDACPSVVELWRRRGDCLRHIGRVGEAEQSYARAAAESLAQESGQTLLQPGWSLLRLEDWAGARAAFGQVRRRKGGTLAGRSALYWESVALLRQGLYERAALGFRNVLFDLGAPDSLRVRAQLGLGDCRLCLGDQQGAAEWYRGILVSPGAPREVLRAAHVSLCDCQGALGHWDEAGALLAKLEQNFPEVPDLAERHLQVAEGQWRAEDYRPALASYGAFLIRVPASDPRVPEVTFRMARCREALGEREQAAAAFEALGADPSYPQRAEALLRLGMLRLGLGQPRAALVALEQRLTLGLDPAQTALTRARLAESYEALGEHRAARNEWEKVAGAEGGASDSLRAEARRRLHDLGETVRERER